MSARTLTSILGNSQRLDGGAMFGNAPKVMWERWIAPDDQNRIPLACRCLLIRDAGRTILLETGIGAFFEPALRARYGVVEDDHVLVRSLAAVGVSPQDVDVVVLSHLHFDHAGGALTTWRDGEAPALVFPRARWVVGAEAWARALRPHPRDRASFIPALPPLLEASGRLEKVTGERSVTLGDGFTFHRSHGHTPGLLLTEVAMPDGPVLFAADLIPGRAWVHLPITMGYDRYAELLIDEKTALLADLLGRDGRLFFTHDPEIALGTLARDERGRFHTVDEHATIADLAA
ncbi:MAG: MBL fold metallo-hydrolase [Kofleriaceae bacterium]|nr:MBL fold metallo-hydrolase [Myxococcales bacterium]MCB9561795.1 MBL fold metallo-hydrolase [Kofleriaceae bacterium]MCB9574188.1 MBL fold metallo-hydrolase [Kofleriaceae bacterium]